MGIELSVSTSLDALSEQLISDLYKDKAGVFDFQWIVTQTEGSNNRLRQQIAVKTGITANVRFINMKEVLQKLYYTLCPGQPMLMDRDRMTWAIYAVLNQREFKEKYPDISEYYHNNDSCRVSLASEMADLFDQYQIYRHEKIAQWKKKIKEKDTNIEWQAYLWAKMRDILGADYADQIDISLNLITTIKESPSKEKIKKLFPCLRFFGQAIFTPYYLEIFSVLSENIDIKIYLLNPCPEQFWMHDVSEQKIANLRQKQYSPELRTRGNELLVNWGNVLKESFYLLLENDAYVNVYNVIDNLAHETTSNTLLRQLQYEIHNNIPNEERKKLSADQLKDDSLHIVGCYTPVREVEVLYNRLIDLFSSDKNLGARDVLVMVSDIDAYAPYIRAVFDNAPVEIPYSIADESVSGGNSLFTALQEILSVNPKTFKAEDVLSLLDSPYIRKRFGFSDISDVRSAVRDAGIFFGHPDLNTEYITDENEVWMVSWQYGLKKIMYGLCMSGEEEYNDGQQRLYPLDTAEGSSTYDRVRLYHFIETLKNILSKRGENKTLSQWSNYLGEVMQEMILDEDEDDVDFPLFANLLESIGSMNEIFDEPISFITFRQVFLSKLQQEKRSGYFAGKGVNFCSMIPMRSIPFKVIALLGMDFDKFPRQDSMLSFSILAKGEPRPGDRSLRENDKHLFLESVLAAGEYLYISYLARDVQKGNEQPPSTLVDELLDYITIHLPDPDKYKKNKIIIHPLHLFSNKYRNDASSLSLNYLGNTLLNENDFLRNDSPADTLLDFTEISLEQMGSFFNHPVKYYFNKQLGIYYNNDEERLSESEPFELNALNEWEIKDELLRKNPDITEFVDRKKRKGKLPLANMGKVLVEQIQEDITPFKIYINALINNETPERIAIQHVTGGSLIKGSMEVYGNKYIEVSYSSTAVKKIFRPWIKYLFARAEGKRPLDFYFVFKNKTKEPELLFVSGDDISQGAAQKIVDKLTSYFKQGHERLFPFYPPLAYSFYKHTKTIPPSRVINRDELYESLESFNEKDAENKYDLIFSDGGYLEKVIEPEESNAGYFSEKNIDEMNNLIPELMDLLFDSCPVLFNK